MRLFLRITIIIFLVLAILFTASYFYVKQNGKRLVTDGLQKAFRSEVTLSDVRFEPLFNISISDLCIPDYGQVKKVTLRLSWLQLFKKEIRLPLLRLQEPFIFLRRTSDAKLILGKQKTAGKKPMEETPKSPEGGIVQTPQGQKQKQETLRFVIDRLIIEQGSILFADQSFEEPFQCVATDVFLNMRHLAYPFKDIKTAFLLKAALKKKEREQAKGRVEVRGWVNLGEKDAKANAKITDLESTLFSDYYTKPKESRYKGVINLAANINAKNNDAIVSGEFKIKSIAQNPEEGTNKDSFSIEDYILEGLQSVQAQIVTEFRFQTKLDNFKIEKVAFKGRIQQ